MNILRDTTLETDPDAAIQAAERLESLLSGHDAAPRKILHLVPGKRAVFAGRYHGRQAVFHLALSQGSCKDQRNRHDEQMRVHGFMADGIDRVPEPLALLGDGAVMVSEKVNGTPLLDHLWSVPAAERIALMPRAAGWLRSHAATTQIMRPVNRGPWRKWAEAGAAQQPHRQLRKIEAEILALMQSLSRKLAGEATWRAAKGHGDYHPNNLLLDGDGVLWGIDLGSSSMAPVYRDAARFLVHCARRDMLPSGQRRFGVDAGAYDAFCDAFAMTPVEREGFLPFFLCYAVLARVDHAQLPAKRITHTRVMSEALRDDLKALLA